jgi:Ca-activated chloride channel family protein
LHPPPPLRLRKNRTGKKAIKTGSAKKNRYGSKRISTDDNEGFQLARADERGAHSNQRLPGRLRLRAAAIFGRELRTRKQLVSTNGWLIALFLLMALPSAARRLERQLSEDRPRDQDTIQVNVDLVVLHGTVRSHNGPFVSGLGKENFQVYEDGVPQQISSFSSEDIPVTVGLVVDNSGSMRPKIGEVFAAAMAFARSSNPADQMFVVQFNENVSFGLPADTPFTDKEPQLRMALSRIKATGMTALYDAVAAALAHVEEGNRDKKVLIVISDGADNASKHKLTQLMAMAKQSDTIIYTMGLFEDDDPDRNPGVLKQLARATGGEAFFPESLKEVVPICQQIAHEIRNQYTIAYVPTNRKQDGAYRVIQVKASAPGRGRLSVRTRAGYYAHWKPQPLPAVSNLHEIPK